MHGRRNVLRSHSLEDLEVVEDLRELGLELDHVVVRETDAGQLRHVQNFSSRERHDRGPFEGSDDDAKAGPFDLAQGRLLASIAPP